GSDPVGPAEGLFGEEFIRACYKGLADDGVLTAQTESPWVKEYHQSMDKVFSSLGAIFTVSRMYLAYIPLYPAGMWSFACAGKGADPLSDDTLNRVKKGLEEFGDKLRYYNTSIHE